MSDFGQNDHSVAVGPDDSEVRLHSGLQQNDEEENDAFAYEQQEAGVALNVDADARSDDDEDEWLDPDNPLLARVQAALTKQLTKADEQVTLQLREKSEAVARVKKQREALGVELYGLQQQLAKAQQALDKTHALYGESSAQRVRASEELQQRLSDYNDMLTQQARLVKEQTEARGELDTLLNTLQHIEKYNQELASDIDVTRRAVYGTEEQTQKVEKEKLAQDLALDRLNTSLRKANEELELYAAQAEAQKQATQGANEILAETQKEIDVITDEKKELVSQWRVALVGITRRNEALQEAQDEHRKGEEDMLVKEMAIKGHKAASKAEAIRNEKIVAVLNRVQNETRFLESQIHALEETRKELVAQFVAMKTSLEEQSAALARAKVEERQLHTQVGALQSAREVLLQKKHKLQEELLKFVGEQSTIEKGAQHLYKNTLKLREKITEKEQEMTEVENELARIRVDTLNTQAHNKELQASVQEFERELHEKDKLIEKYEQEIRQRHDAIEKKQIYIVRLNRKLDEAATRAASGNEEVQAMLGPLEATINNLQKEINAKGKESGELQREWIKAQTELVGLVGELEVQQEKAQELQGKQTVLQQKSLRIDRAFAACKGEIKELDASIRGMHSGFVKLNELIAKNRELSQTLRDKTFTMQSDFVEKVRVLEQQSEALKVQLHTLQSERESLMAELVEMERQVMLWEKKIQLEKETQQALDPEYGQNEIRSMQKEIHRMELRLAQLQREQEKMIVDMEKVVSKQESIKLTHTATKTKEHFTNATLKKRIVDIKLALKTNVKEVSKIEEETKTQEGQHNALLERLEQAQKEYGSKEGERVEKQLSIEGTDLTNRLAKEQLRILQQKAKKYTEASEGKLKVASSADALSTRLVSEETRLLKMVELLDQLSAQQPKHAEFFKQLATFAAV